MRGCCLSGILLCVLLAGCGGGDSKTAPQGTNRSGNGNGNGAAVPWQEDRKLDLKIAGWDQIEKEIASHKGKVVVVDFWASWCAPCVAELPRLVELQRRHQDDVVCLTVNLDYTEEISKEPKAPSSGLVSKVRGTLSGVDARFEHFITTTLDEEIYARAGLMTVPSTVIYDQSGKRVARVDLEYVLSEWKKAGSSGTKPGDGDIYESGVFPLVERLLAR